MDRNELARNAFYGNNDDLYNTMCEIAGYELDGQHYPANGLSLAECIEIADRMDVDTLALYA